MDAFDLVVIGTGTAAQVASARVRKAGRSVAIIDRLPFGGTCALRGCDPKKMLLSGAEVIDAAHRMQAHGVTGQVQIEWKDLIAFKRTFTNPIPKKRELSFEEQGIRTFHGAARFVAPDAVEVDGQELRGRHILIASGAHPIPLTFPGSEYLTTSDSFMELELLPERIVIVGGGYIAAEFSHIAARAGAKITVLQRSDRMLRAFDPELVFWLMERFRGIGVDVRTGNTVASIERSNDGYTVHAQKEAGVTAVEADLVVHAAGRAPALDDLDLSAGNVATDRGRLRLNQFLQSTSNPIVYAAGDAAAKGPPLTPISSHEGKIVARNILDGNREVPDYRGVPSVAFTLPPIASVGLSDGAARKSGIKVRTKLALEPNWFSARRLGETVYGYKTIIEEDSGRILGAHLVGPQVDELINIFGLAIRYGLTARDLKNAIFAYPTGASDIGYML
jgi:glutathione reductase (NADPH)